MGFRFALLLPVKPKLRIHSCGARAGPCTPSVNKTHQSVSSGEILQVEGMHNQHKVCKMSCCWQRVLKCPLHSGFQLTRSVLRFFLGPVLLQRLAKLMVLLLSLLVEPVLA